MSEQEAFNFNVKNSLPPSNKFSDFIVYVDESGDHGLTNIDTNYPVFSLAFCIFYKKHYTQIMVPKLQQLKFNYFGHDLVILHEHDIRKENGDFNIFKGKSDRNTFLDSLHQIIESSNFILASCVIHKSKLQISNQSKNPYHIALKHCLETLYDLVSEKGQQNLETHIVVEQRGKKEDAELELEFRRICDNGNKFQQQLPFKIRMANKTSNSAGLQLADLVARPIGRHAINPEQPNRAFEVLKHKFYCQGGRANIGENYLGWGLKQFP